MTDKAVPEFVKPSRLRVKTKAEKEEHVKNRIPKHDPYHRDHNDYKAAWIKGEFEDENE